MRQSRTPSPAHERRERPRRISATTAAGMAAERIALADRERRIAAAGAAARHLAQRPVSR